MESDSQDDDVTARESSAAIVEAMEVESEDIRKPQGLLSDHIYSIT